MLVTGAIVILTLLVGYRALRGFLTEWVCLHRFEAATSKEDRAACAARLAELKSLKLLLKLHEMAFRGDWDELDAAWAKAYLESIGDPGVLLLLEVIAKDPENPDQGALRLLCRMGPLRRGAGDELRRALSSSDLARRDASVHVLQAVKCTDEIAVEMVPELWKVSIECDSRDIRVGALYALGTDQALCRAALPLVLDKLEHGRRSEQENAAWALYYSACRGPGVVRAVADVFQEADEGLRVLLAQSLSGVFGGDDFVIGWDYHCAVLSTVDSMLWDESKRVRDALAESLSVVVGRLVRFEVGQSEVAGFVSELVDTMEQHAKEEYRVYAAEYLGALKGAARPAIPALTQAVESGHPGLQRAAADSLAQINAASEKPKEQNAED